MKEKYYITTAIPYASGKPHFGNTYNDVKGMQCGAVKKDSRIANFKWEDGKETSLNRVTSYLKKLVDCGDVIKTIDKKVTYFRLA